MENETSECQTDGLYFNPGRIVDGEISASQSQVIVNKIDKKIRKAVDSAVRTIKNHMLDAIFAAMVNVVIPRAEMAVRPITGSSGHGPNSTIQNPDGRDLIRNRENTPFKSASSRLDLNIYQDRKNETLDFENFQDGDFPVLRPNFDRQSHAHHTCSSSLSFSHLTGVHENCESTLH